MSATLSFWLAEEWWCRRATPVWIVLALLVTAAVVYLTYRPGAGYVFIDGERLDKVVK